MKVRITQAPPGAWYENEVGTEIEVHQLTDGDVVLLEDWEKGWEYDWRYIASKDCEIIKATG